MRFIILEKTINNEIDRLGEVTFRVVAEGTNKSIRV